MNSRVWSIVRLAAHAVVVILAFAFLAALIMVLEDSTSTTPAAWMIVGAILLLLIGQVPLVAMERDRVRHSAPRDAVWMVHRRSPATPP